VVIEKITPVSVVDQGRNFFRVEASATGDIAKLRPGMEGVGKIHVDRASCSGSGPTSSPTGCACGSGPGGREVPDCV
jgi:hypothetical protein